MPKKLTNTAKRAKTPAFPGGAPNVNKLKNRSKNTAKTGGGPDGRNNDLGEVTKGGAQSGKLMKKLRGGRKGGGSSMGGSY